MTLSRLSLVLALVLGPASLGLADSIVLKSVARLPAGTDVVRLADIAHLDGDEATRLASVEVARVPDSGVLELPLDSIRQRLSAAGARWPLIDLSGRAVTVRAPADDRPKAMAPMAVEPPPTPREAEPATTRVEFDADEALSDPTPRGLIARSIAAAHADKKARVRLVIEDVDRLNLDDADPSRRHELVPVSSLSTDRVVLRLSTREGDRLVARREIVVRPLLGVRAATTIVAIRRGGAIQSDAIEVSEALVPPSEFGRIADPERLGGAVAVESIKAGARLAESDIKRIAEIKRNDKVAVRRELELVAIELTAVALEDGAVGEEILLQIVDRKNRRDRRSFTATVTGPGRAVVR